MDNMINQGLKKCDEMNLINIFKEFMEDEDEKYRNCYSFSYEGYNDYLIYYDYLIYEEDSYWVLDCKKEEKRRLFTNLYDLLKYFLFKLDINDYYFDKNSDLRIPIGTNVIIDDNYVGKYINGENPKLKKGIIIDSIFDSYSEEMVYKVATDDNLVLASHNSDFQDEQFRTIEEYIFDLNYEIDCIESLIEDTILTKKEIISGLKVIKEKVLEYKDECLNSGDNKIKK